MKNLKFLTPAITLGVLTLSTLTASAAAFTAGDLVIYRVGTGSAALSNAATAVFLDEYTPSGTLVQSIALPTTTTGQNALTASGTATSEGQINLSSDGQYLALTGYNAVAGTAAVAGTTAATVSRTIGVVRGDGSVDTTTSLSNFADKNNIRSAYTADGTNIYAGGATGSVYTTVGSTSVSSTGVLSAVNTRDISVFNGQLYYTTGSGTTGLYALGSGMPTSGTQTSALVQASGSPYAFAFAKLGSGSGSAPDTLYIADDGATGTTGGITKYSLVGGVWTATGTVGSKTNAFRGLTLSISGSAVNLFATNATGLFSLTDTTGFNGTLAGTPGQIATVSANEAFRGVAFAPQAIVTAATPAPSSLLVVLVGVPGIGLMLRRRRAAK